VTLSRGLPVEIRPNRTRNEILSAAASSGVYLHTMPGEHFGISIIEAMAAGLIPVVPDSGGAVEFVHPSLRYRDERQAAEIIVDAKSASDSLRRSLSKKAEAFSEVAFRSNFKEYLRSLGF
jgi:alpha-1,2-mannosyltransferase